MNMHEYFIICGILVEKRKMLFTRKEWVFFSVQSSQKVIQKCKMRK